MSKLFPGFEGCDSAWDLGWKHAVEDRAMERDPEMTFEEWKEYQDGYREANRGWDR